RVREPDLHFDGRADFDRLGGGTFPDRDESPDPLLGQVAAEKQDADQYVHGKGEQPGLEDQGGDQNGGKDEEKAAQSQFAKPRTPLTYSPPTPRPRPADVREADFAQSFSQRFRLLTLAMDQAPLADLPRQRAQIGQEVRPVRMATEAIQMHHLDPF